MYVMSEKYKKSVDNTIAQSRTDLTNGRRRSRGGGYSRPTPASVYDGPFAVSDSSEDESLKVTIAAGLVFAGITKIAVAETEKSITATCVIYIEVTFASTYKTEFKTAEALPDPVSGKYIKGIAEITVTDSKISDITQIWAGNIEVVGRFT